MFFNGEAVQIIHPPAAQTDGDSIVFFRRSDVIATGDIFTTTMYPFIDAPRGGSVNGDHRRAEPHHRLAIPDHKVQEGGTMIIPGHGRLCDEQDVIEYRDMVTIVRDRIQYMIRKGMTLDQVKAARPTLDFDPRYGTDTGFWTTAMFIEHDLPRSEQEEVVQASSDEETTMTLRRDRAAASAVAAAGAIAARRALVWRRSAEAGAARRAAADRAGAGGARSI